MARDPAEDCIGLLSAPDCAMGNSTFKTGGCLPEASVRGCTRRSWSGRLMCLPIYVMDWGTNVERKIDNVPDGGRAEETGRFLDLLHVFMQHAQGERA
jgi:hypothetical protein